VINYFQKTKIMKSRKMKPYIRVTTLLIVVLLVHTNCIFSQVLINKKKVVSLQIDGSKRFQQIDGIGVNANTRSWNGKELEPALNLLLDSMHATIWRIIVETVEKWEDVNDNDDPFTFNWDYYNKLYETPKFQKVWEMIGYLNQHGITDKLMINFMGFAPQWMGVKNIKPEYEDEYVEMIVSFFYYAKNTKHLQFGLIAPTNESDHHNFSEGPHLDAKQHARIIRKLIDRMEAVGIMKDIRIVAPDNASIDKSIMEFIPALMEDSIVMSKIAHLGFHTYGGYNPVINDFISKSTYPKSSYWVTEWNAWCKGCDDGILGEYNYDFAGKCVGYLLDLFKNGATAAIAWEGYDSYYEHHAPSPFSYWGMLAYKPDTKTYLPRKNFYAIQQVSKFVLPGSWRISVSEPGDSLIVLAFHDEGSKTVSIIGINKSHSPVNLNGTLANLPAINKLEMYYTNNTENVHRDVDVMVKGKAFKTTIPTDCIFTLTGTDEKNTSVINKRLKPEPSDWYSGDIHVHLNCGTDSILPYNKLLGMMEPNDLAVISVLTDMGNAEVKDSKADLPKVNGTDAPQSKTLIREVNGINISPMI
jgi:O-glycosyl hydrolase